MFSVVVTLQYSDSLLWISQEQKNRAKKKTLLLKAFKMLKSRDAGYLISIPEAVSMVAGMIGNVRCVIA